MEEKKKRFPFGIPFQNQLLRLLTTDPSFASQALKHLQADYFENDVASWAYSFLVKYYEKYGSIPTLPIIIEETKELDSSIRDIYQETLKNLKESPSTNEEWLKDKTITFVKKNVFVSAILEARDLYNQDEVEKAYECMSEKIDRLYHTEWGSPDRSFFFKELEQRNFDRRNNIGISNTIPTGLTGLDRMMDGGLSVGEFGIWLALPKCGKSTMLINHGVNAIRRTNVNVYHAVLEGSRGYTENRYDALLTQCLYTDIKHGEMSSSALEQAKFEYKLFSNRLVVRGFTEHWDYSIVDIAEDLKDLERLHGWVPTLVIIDYGDLLGPRGKGYKNEYDKQKAAYQDMKSLANKGYAVWTATQAQRPESEADTTTLLKSRQIAECYGKVRIADFIGSINITPEERKQQRMRLYAELHRDEEADKIFPVKADFARMTITNLSDSDSPFMAQSQPALQQGMEARIPQQYRAPI